MAVAIESSWLTSRPMRVIACPHTQVLLYFILPGQVVDGVPIDAKGTRLKYPLNGRHAQQSMGAAAKRDAQHSSREPMSSLLICCYCSHCWLFHLNSLQVLPLCS